MPGLILPEEVTIRLLSEDRTPYRVPEVILGVYTSRCSKSNYRFGPFFSNADGIVTITRAMLDLEVKDHLSTALMDHGAIEDCAPEVTIRVWTALETTRAADARRTTWRILLDSEEPVYNSLEELIDRLVRAANARLGLRGEELHGSWDGSRSRLEYQYVVHQEPPAELTTATVRRDV